MNEEVIQLCNQTQQDNHGNPRLFSDLAITTALIVKRALFMPLRGPQGLINFVFKLVQLPAVAMPSLFMR
ncbi:Mobile element protein [Candidatus Enterovibrio altilux]|uniref:Mobile element protein n=1 Tax=Candidatus Enterovibrio altilux TaxID=1927128 RepID=A0A291B8P0_9GAMM|nr:Mobile element protein [Candidatus Enterovibrio luxaltus]